MGIFGPRPSRGDQQVLDQLREVGSNLSLPHSIEHFLYFPEEAAAREVASALAAEGYRAEARPGADGKDWLVLASHTVVPSPRQVATNTLRMEKLAASFGGEYDGWGAGVVK